MTEDTLNDTARLTEEERAERRCNCDFCYWDEHYTRAAVEAIIAARTAALARDRDASTRVILAARALADEWAADVAAFKLDAPVYLRLLRDLLSGRHITEGGDQ